RWHFTSIIRKISDRFVATMRDPLKQFRSRTAAKLLRRSGLVDTDWYLAQNPDVARAGVDPSVHYLNIGAAEGRDPNPLFDPDWYFGENPDVARTGVNPLVHYLKSGAAPWRDPSPLFDTDWYLCENPHIARTAANT